MAVDSRNLDRAIPDNMLVELSVLDCAPLELFWEENWVSCASLTSSLDSVDTVGMSITEGSLSSMPMSLFMASTSDCSLNVTGRTTIHAAQTCNPVSAHLHLQTHHAVLLAKGAYALKVKPVHNKCIQKF